MTHIETVPRTGYLVAIIITLFLNNNLYSQYEWSTPQALTDSVSDNTNPDIELIGPYLNNQLYMVWEKSMDSTSTSIYFKDFLSTNIPIEILSNDSIHYMNPQIVQSFGGAMPDNILFYLFYETNQNGNKDIYYLKYFTDGNFSEPSPFFLSQFKDYGIVSDGFNIIWLQEDKILFTRYDDDLPNFFIDPVIIDEGGCYNPVLGVNSILWEKRIDSLSHIYGAHATNIGLTWSEPEVIYDSGYAVNLNHSPYGIHRLATFSAFTDSTWKLFSCYYNLYSPPISFKEYDIQQNEPFDPAISIYKIGQYNLLDNNYISFPYEENENEEIYMNLDPFISNFTNLSNSSTNNRNPNFFMGSKIEGSTSLNEIYNVWESYRNDHWQLYYSKSLITVVDINEKLTNKHFFNTTPNPFKSTINISYKLMNNSLVNIEVYDLYGKIIATVLDSYQYKGEQNIKWSFPAELPSGIYFIILSKDNERYSQNIIKSD